MLSPRSPSSIHIACAVMGMSIRRRQAITRPPPRVRTLTLDARSARRGLPSTSWPLGPAAPLTACQARRRVLPASHMRESAGWTQNAMLEDALVPTIDPRRPQRALEVPSMDLSARGRLHGVCSLPAHPQARLTCLDVVNRAEYLCIIPQGQSIQPELEIWAPVPP
jgi:hypothetical protein